MKRTTTFVFCAALLLVFAPGEIRTLGRPEPSAPDHESEPPSAAMGRLAAISAQFGATGGRWAQVILPDSLQGQQPPARAAQEFRTDFSRAAVAFDEVVAGGPPKDGIPSIDQPRFVTVAQADDWLEAREPVIVYRDAGSTRIYPLQILTWHEIVNDEIDGRPIAVTYCPLCNTGMVFDRRFDDEVLEFGVSGRLIYSNMIMYDRTTESWWIQATGAAIAGHYAGQRLRLLPSTVHAWRDARDAFPDAQVLSRDTGHRRAYGRNPYAGYDTAREPFLYRGPRVVEPDRNPMERVLTVYHGQEVDALTYSRLREEAPVELELDGAPIVVFWEPGTASALDASQIPDGRDVGSAAAFIAELDGRRLTFIRDDRRLVDRETGSSWTITGIAASGPLEGRRLEPALSVEHFYFSFRAFHGE